MIASKDGDCTDICVEVSCVTQHMAVQIILSTYVYRSSHHIHVKYTEKLKRAFLQAQLS